MTTISPAQSPQWRLLTTAELVASPEARLGGALAVMLWGAIAMVLGGALTVAWLIVFGDFFSVTMMLRGLFSGSTLSSRIATISMIPQAVFFIWSFVFAVMTMGRNPSTPKVASVLMVLWAVSAIGAAVGARYLIAQSNFDLVSQASLVPFVLLQVVLVSAFCGYMSEGRRPNIYFRKRVRA